MTRGGAGLLLVLVGCGGKAGGGVTTVNPNKTLNTLSIDEASKLCNDVFVYYASHISAVDTCKYSSYIYVASRAGDPSMTDAQLVAGCTSDYESCVASYASNPPPIPTCGTPPPTFSADCAVTVAQYSTCVADEANAINAVGAAVPWCSMLDRAGLAALNADGGFGGVAEPESCWAYEQACPGGILPLPY